MSFSHSRFACFHSCFMRCWRQNPGLHACQASTMPTVLIRRLTLLQKTVLCNNNKFIFLCGFLDTHLVLKLSPTPFYQKDDSHHQCEKEWNLQVRTVFRSSASWANTARYSLMKTPWVSVSELGGKTIVIAPVQAHPKLCREHSKSPWSLLLLFSWHPLKRLWWSRCHKAR